MRFIRRSKGTAVTSDFLSSDEIQQAEVMWLKYLQKRTFSEVFESITTEKANDISKQLDLFIDSKGLLRCGGRLSNSCLTEAAKHPILLPQHDHLTQLYIQQVHKRILHSGISQTLSELRQTFWVPHGRATVRKILKNCRICERIEGGPYKLPPMAPLPKSRLSVSTPFSNVGVDYFGPLYTKENKVYTKIWICLFTCLVTRAVHLEVVQDMTAKTFLCALRRFIAVRGTPGEIISDNAKQFKLSKDTVNLVWSKAVYNSDVQDYVSKNGIKWSFIVELAPWMGGFYERLVGIVKRALRKIVGRRFLSLDQMMTVFKEAEAVVNSRPLVYIGDDIKSTVAVTPRHFLCLNPHIGIPDSGPTNDDSDYKTHESSSDLLLKIWKKGEKLLNEFWQIWRTDYLTSLRERFQQTLKSSRVQSHRVPKIGDVVLIKDNVPRGQWRMGKLIKICFSRDGLIRSAEVKTSAGKVFRRPLNLLFPIETVEVKDENDAIDGSTNAVFQKDSENPKRKAAVKARTLNKQILNSF